MKKSYALLVAQAAVIRDDKIPIDDKLGILKILFDEERFAEYSEKQEATTNG